LIAWLFYQLILNIIRLRPSLFLHPYTHAWISGLTLLFLTTYFLFCESTPSLTRAYIAISCYLVARILGRSRDLLNILFLAASLILLIQPHDLFNLSSRFLSSGFSTSGKSHSFLFNCSSVIKPPARHSGERWRRLI